ncbi:tail fiber domain-containing protein [Flavobacterium sp. SM15]|uniref:tail fiber domain-containing protein n=1 Tax=Flavobacterium sp. SM15 TaxID=2908005 RepID=UPI001EDABB1F|nr:tail fiber domain-containing protein [Flavobacterium sp. SM15]MCG2610349.1 tail fiber domain-containing protein [Flavobacterium sp. SM15]
MKTFIRFSIFALVFVINTTVQAQVGIGTTTPNSSSVLDVTSTTAGLLTPRMTMAQRNAITTPATGLLIYQTDNTPGFYYYNSSAWVPFGGSGWGLTGNAGTTVGTNFLGTTDNQDFAIKTNNTEAIRVKNDGKIGIGNTAPSSKIHITGTTVPGVTGGTTNLINQNFSSYTVTQNYTPDAACTTTTGWTTSSAAPASYVCTTCVAPYLYIDSDDSGCDQVATAYMNFTPTTSSVAVSFGYRFDEYSSGVDSFRVYLYNNGTSAQVGANLVSAAVDVNSTYSGTLTVTPGVSYSLRFEYIGTYSFGATVDNVLVTETVAPVTGSYVFRLEDGTQAAGKVLTSDANGNAYWQVPGGGSGSGSTYTFTNGLTNASGTVKLGGALIESTTIGATSFPLNVSSVTKPYMLRVDNDEDVVKFGHDTTLSDEGAALTIDGYATTVKYLTSAKNGNSRGTAVGVGSIEYLVDGEATIASSFSLTPTITNTYDLGTSASRWSNIYLQNAPIVTSDVTLKKNIKTLGYGLKELMKLTPISYQWKNDYIGKTLIPEHLRQTSLGFSAQELQTVLPEVVKTHDWKIKSEATPDQYEYVQNDKLGVMYSQIIPVTVKAIQEQQAEIEELKTAVKELKAQNEMLMQLLQKK